MNRISFFFTFEFKYSVDNSNDDKTHDFIIPDNVPENEIWLKFLYRPGHYDLIYEKEPNELVDLTNVD